MIRVGIVAMALIVSGMCYIGPHSLCHETTARGELKYTAVATSPQTASMTATAALQEPLIEEEVKLRTYARSTASILRLFLRS